MALLRRCRAPEFSLAFIVAISAVALLFNHILLTGSDMLTTIHLPSFVENFEVTIPIRNEEPALVIFYNIFVAKDNEDYGIPLARKVVEEQINQLGRSFVATLDTKPTIYYNTIGHRAGVTEDYMNELCSERNNITCKHLEHHDVGYEEITLQSVYNHCTTNALDKVVYLHSKGSYHENPSNKLWRKDMLAAVTNHSCIDPPDSSCNLCGLLFFPTWSFLMPGNFWVADCSYIKKLRPPINYAVDMAAVHGEIVALEKQNLIDARTLYPDEEYSQGVGRFASEHWVASHPDVIPCDLSKTNDILFWHRGRKNKEWNLEFDMAPRASIEADWYTRFNDLFRDEVISNQTFRMRERFLLPGLLVKWFKLYNTTPPDSSWIWNWYPDGQVWKEGVNKHGNDVLRVVASSYLTV